MKEAKGASFADPPKMFNMQSDRPRQAGVRPWSRWEALRPMERSGMVPTFGSATDRQRESRWNDPGTGRGEVGSNPRTGEANRSHRNGETSDWFSDGRHRRYGGFDDCDQDMRRVRFILPARGRALQALSGLPDTEAEEEAKEAPQGEETATGKGEP